MKKIHLAAYPATAVIAFGVGMAAASGDVLTAAPASPAVTKTVVRTVPGPTTFATVTAGPTVTVTAAAPTPEAAMSGDGTFEVGIDVKPGKYVSSTPDSGNCYWARLSGSGTSDDIIDNDNTSGQSVVIIKKTDAFFESSGCNDWVRR